MSTRIYRSITQKLNVTAVVRQYSTKFTTEITPGPPRLAKEDQEEFERLQRQANTQIAIEEFNDKISKAKSTESSPSESHPELDKTFQYYKIVPEFEGDVNPKTGEVGGPKQEPLRHGDWAYNGRVTDF
jgi:hypothetical protein